MRAIDQQRWYSNWGPLSQRLEERFAGHFGLGERSCIPASSGTDALVGALIAAAGRGRSDKPYCFMPSYTFVATAAAALNAGYEPYFVDVDEETFALSPQAFMQHPEILRAGAIMVVAPYGRAVDVGAWAEVSERTGVPVVIDAAAGFDAIASGYMKPVGRVPVVASFHATKVFGIGEGGAILCGNGDLAERCRRALNFGFLGDRIATITGINGKMSEYQAAVALAEFDAWPQKKNAFLRVARRYLDAASRHGLTDRLVAEDAWASSYVLYRAPTMTEGGLVTRKLGEAKIDHRLWYGAGLHRQHAYANFSADPLPVTESLAPRLIGLPMSIDIGDQDIERVVATLASARSSS
jgi:dTDP-4-amino-4,6-dideoxygalactose transaminase